MFATITGLREGGYEHALIVFRDNNPGPMIAVLAVLALCALASWIHVRRRELPAHHSDDE